METNLSEPTIWGVDAATLTTFDNAYKASQPLAVQALFNLGPGTQERYALAYQLVAQGFFIDVPIMVWGTDPYIAMLQRQADGYTTYPDALYAQTRPVDTDPAHYPPIVIPAPQGNLVGPIIGFGPYYFVTNATVAAHLPPGYKHSENGQNFVLQNIQQQSLSGQTQTIQRWKTDN